MKVRMQKILKEVLSMAVVYVVFICLWNFMLPAFSNISAISYWESFSIVAHLFGIWHLFKLVDKEAAEDNEPALRVAVVG